MSGDEKPYVTLQSSVEYPPHIFKRKEKQRLFSEHTILSLLESLLRNTSTSYLCLALTKCLLIKNVHCEIYIEKQHKSVLGWAHGFVQNSSTIVLHANSKVLRFHI